MPEQSYNKLSEMRRVNNSSEPRVKVDQFLVSGQREEEIRKSLKINSDDNLKRRLEGGSQRKLKVVDTRSNLQAEGLQQDQIFVQTNLSGMIIKNIPAVQSVPRAAVGKRVKEYEYARINQNTEQRKIKWKLSDINPVISAGEMGTGVQLSPGELKRSKEMFPLYQFDSVVSDKIALNRRLPDDRPPRCKSYRYHIDLPSTSIIIAFHNEAKSTFLRTIHSVVNRSPGHLITEIILVNDASNLGDWHRSPWLLNYLANFSVPIHLYHSPERIGVVGARMLGLSKVSNRSDVVTFLDSHCECTEGWLEPLLQRISKDRTRVVSPVVDAIDEHTFEYVGTVSWPHIGGFSWFPEFMWIRVPPEEKKRVYGDYSLPLRTPTISGGLFAIDKNFFRQLGFYDPGLKIWGGENLELSFKVWQCGGSLEIVPCSRVGHVFRSTTPYSFLGDPEHVFLHNNRRILETWAQGYSHVFYTLTPKYREVQYGSVEDRLNLKKSLKCKDFDWYLEHVYPGHILPQNYEHLGQIVNKRTGHCLDNSAAGESTKLGSRVTLSPCRRDNMNQNDHLLHARTKQCLTRSSGTMTPLTDEKQFVMIQNCSDTQEQTWIMQSISLTRNPG
ncbi:putative polypeptide N-acetylgalactosaminyltransferase 1 [Apostichopus japonicus]|uniref:Polypeptide N-acetylgalactosaminyltransferase n=1 Tax=Stichopus japonicus TaxID=307972 RepID=A0A2G8KIQ2_STIJA|nr:putative polypeptide N-acetylgalactosaminyltransferase 1 [Apostichopus japonicus]